MAPGAAAQPRALISPNLPAYVNPSADSAPSNCIRSRKSTRQKVQLLRPLKSGWSRRTGSRAGLLARAPAGAGRGGPVGPRLLPGEGREQSGSGHGKREEAAGLCVCCPVVKSPKSPPGRSGGSEGFPGSSVALRITRSWPPTSPTCQHLPSSAGSRCQLQPLGQGQHQQGAGAQPAPRSCLSQTCSTPGQRLVLVADQLALPEGGHGTALPGSHEWVSARGWPQGQSHGRTSGLRAPPSSKH